MAEVDSAAGARDPADNHPVEVTARPRPTISGIVPGDSPVSTLALRFPTHGVRADPDAPTTCLVGRLVRSLRRTALFSTGPGPCSVSPAAMPRADLLVLVGADAHNGGTARGIGDSRIRRVANIDDAWPTLQPIRPSWTSAPANEADRPCATTVRPRDCPTSLERPRFRCSLPPCGDA